MIILFFSKIFTISERELFYSWTKDLVKTNITNYTDTLKLIENSRYVHKDPLDYSSCNATEYFSYIEPLDISELNYDDLEIASRYIYLKLIQDKLYRKTLKEMLKYKPLIYFADKFENFHKYVLSFIENTNDDDETWAPLLLVKSMAYMSYKLIYLLSFVELDEQAMFLVCWSIRNNIAFKTEEKCQWRLNQIMKIFSYNPLCWSIEKALTPNNDKYDWLWVKYFHRKR
ncbi:uncharacterized protein VNE69_02256 [Vairimorpha necatrix]|uniref:Uncharacterized protein n=1 Tax=Vairimorpha necatrix TaxID=6039 RepID=A0AAX4JA14_9MICR